MSKLSAIIAAGGLGARFKKSIHGEKLLTMVNDKPLIYWSILEASTINPDSIKVLVRNDNDILKNFVHNLSANDQYFSNFNIEVVSVRHDLDLRYNIIQNIPPQTIAVLMASEAFKPREFILEYLVQVNKNTSKNTVGIFNESPETHISLVNVGGEIDIQRNGYYSCDDFMQGRYVFNTEFFLAPYNQKFTNFLSKVAESNKLIGLLNQYKPTSIRYAADLHN
jgi:UTP-glucose-1-phosphate uridylyltransferase